MSYLSVRALIRPTYRHGNRCLLIQANSSPSLLGKNVLLKRGAWRGGGGGGGGGGRSRRKKSWFAGRNHFGRLAEAREKFRAGMSYGEAQFHFSLITMLRNIDYDVSSRAPALKNICSPSSGVSGVAPFSRLLSLHNSRNTFGVARARIRQRQPQGFITEYRERSPRLLWILCSDEVGESPASFIWA